MRGRVCLMWRIGGWLYLRGRGSEVLWGKQVLYDGEELVVHSVEETEGCAENEGMGLWALCEGKRL